MKISSPAYMLPNSRSDRLSGRTPSSMMRSRRFASASTIFMPVDSAWNGAVKISFVKPPTPLCEMPNTWISRNTASARPRVVLRSAVGTTRR